MGIPRAGTMPTIAVMDLHYILAHAVTIIFAIGVAGCAVVIPLAAWKFFSVLLEKDTDEENKQHRLVQLD